MLAHIAKEILGWFGVKFTCGKLTIVASGVKTITVKTGWTPSKVWINPLESGGHPVCQGDCDYFDVKIVPHGFVLIVNLNSEYREIHWIAQK